MNSRREPLLWLQCLAIGAVPLELLLIRVVLAGADPGPVPAVERLLIWSVGGLAAAVALWKRPADWGSLLLVRVPTATRSLEQQTLSGLQGKLGGFSALLAAALLLPMLWWLDDSAGLIQEFSPLQGQSRLVTLLLSAPLLALTVWQVQQLIQAVVWLVQGELIHTEEALDQQKLLLERTSLGLQLLRFEPLLWPDPKPVETQEAEPTAAPEPTAEPQTEPEPEQAPSVEPTQETEPEATPETAAASEPEAESETDAQAEHHAASDSEPDPATALEAQTNAEPEPAPEATQEPESLEMPATDAEPTGEPVPETETEPDPQPGSEQETDAENAMSPESGAGALAVEPEQSSEENEGSDLDTEVPDLNSTSSGSPEGHREETESGGGEESEPKSSPESTPGSL